jgi:eukaryotic-like serine/threonine-protein kinase
MTWLADDAVARLRKIADEPDFSGTRYRLEREIARGGMGVVYEAQDLELQRQVAIKVLATNEARTIAQLEHPGIVPVHDAGTLPDGRMFYVMKLVRGRTLAASDPLRLFLRVCEAVAFAHSRGVIHCDLKPSNVMVGEFGEVLVMDWGVAKSIGAAAIGGTRGFMPPEQERGEPLNATADVFALGCILRMMAPARVPRRLAAIIARSTSPDPGERYPTAGELVADIVHFIDEEPVSAHRENALERAGRWLDRNRAVVALILGYLVMRAIVLLVAHR